jgi:hypothetical protein
MNKKTANKITMVVAMFASHGGGDRSAEKVIGQLLSFAAGLLFSRSKYDF